MWLLLLFASSSWSLWIGLQCVIVAFPDQTPLRDQFEKLIKHYKCVGYSMTILHQSICLVINPRMVLAMQANNFVFYNSKIQGEDLASKID